MRFLKTTFVFALVVFFATSCTSVRQTMREPNARMEWKKDDFTYSAQVTGEATSTRILGIDWSRLFSNKSGSTDGATTRGGIIAKLPVIGNLINDPTGGYALYDLMQKNPGYDVVFYPQYESKTVRPIGIGLLYKKTTVKVTAKLAKIK